jgi:hypothetical protein
MSAVILVIAGMSGLSLAQAGWASDLGLDFWMLPEFSKTLSEQSGRAEELDEQIVRNQAEAKAKALIIQDLIDTKISLKEAITQTMHSSRPEFLELAMECLGIDPSNTEVAVGRLLICWVKCSAANQPQQVASLVTRLEKELAESAINAP